MADKTDGIQQEIKKSRQDIADTRCSLAKKLATLEDRVRENINGIKQTFDLHHQMKQRPWLMFTGSLLVGYKLGRRNGMLSPKSSTSSQSVPAAHPQASTVGSIASQITQVALGTVLSTLGAWAKLALAPTGRRWDTSNIQPESMESPRRITQHVIDSNTNGYREL